MSWMNFSDAPEQVERGGVIPANTLVKVVLKIRPGGHDDAMMGWTGGMATRKPESGAVYLDCEYTVVGGQYDKRKIWSMIGLFSAKGPNWGNQGRALVRGILESARGIDPKDNSERAQKARQITGLSDLNGLEFVAKVSVEPGQGGYEPKNKIEYAVPPTHRDYAAIMAGKTVEGPAPSVSPGAAASSAPKVSTPAWAS